MQKALGAGYAVIEEGLSGRTTVWDDPFGYGRNGRTFLVPCLESHEPVDMLVLMLGTNDLKTFYRVTAADIAHGVSHLVDLALKSGCGPAGGAPRVLIVTPPPLADATRDSEIWGFGGAMGESRKLAEYYAAVAASKPCDFFDAGTVASTSALDGVHLDAESHKRLGAALAACVHQLLVSA